VADHHVGLEPINETVEEAHETLLEEEDEEELDMDEQLEL
jgi:hypothetical protein